MPDPGCLSISRVPYPYGCALCDVRVGFHNHRELLVHRSLFSVTCPSPLPCAILLSNMSKPRHGVFWRCETADSQARARPWNFPVAARRIQSRDTHGASLRFRLFRSPRLSELSSVRYDLQLSAPRVPQPLHRTLCDVRAGFTTIKIFRCRLYSVPVPRQRHPNLLPFCNPQKNIFLSTDVPPGTLEKLRVPQKKSGADKTPET
jgi:hypothetical protein